jgi:hypothetical protein
MQSAWKREPMIPIPTFDTVELTVIFSATAGSTVPVPRVSE